jgi:hypothetical protein
MPLGSCCVACGAVRGGGEPNGVRGTSPGVRPPACTCRSCLGRVSTVPPLSWCCVSGAHSVCAALCAPNGAALDAECSLLERGPPTHTHTHTPHTSLGRGGGRREGEGVGWSHYHPPPHTHTKAFAHTPFPLCARCTCATGRRLGLLGHQVEDFSVGGAGNEPAQRVQAEWPKAGAVAFKNVWMRYRPDLDFAVRGLSVSIPAGAKVGVVGRTGADAGWAGDGALGRTFLFRVRRTGVACAAPNVVRSLCCVPLRGCVVVLDHSALPCRRGQVLACNGPVPAGAGSGPRGGWVWGRGRVPARVCTAPALVAVSAYVPVPVHVHVHVHVHVPVPVPECRTC